MRTVDKDERIGRRTYTREAAGSKTRRATLSRLLPTEPS